MFIYAGLRECGTESTVRTEGEPVFLEASVEAPQHPSLRVYVDHCAASSSPLNPLASPGYKFITNHRVYVDRCAASSSPLYPLMYISCHLRVTLGEKVADSQHKASFFHRPTLRGGPGGCCDASWLGPLRTIGPSAWSDLISVMH
ncbi:unnamed protein product [Merluccius merluccius]